MNTFKHFDVLKLIKKCGLQAPNKLDQIYILINKNDNLDKFVYFGFSSWSDSLKLAATICI